MGDKAVVLFEEIRATGCGRGVVQDFMNACLVLERAKKETLPGLFDPKGEVARDKAIGAVEAMVKSGTLQCLGWITEVLKVIFHVVANENGQNGQRGEDGSPEEVRR